MSKLAVLTDALAFNRGRTLALLDKIVAEPDPQAILGWRPGTGRAHLAWQFMHIGITEEIFATERLNPDKPGEFRDLWPRFRGGSTPDDAIPPAEEIRALLAETRAHLLATLHELGEARLGEIPASWKERGLTLEQIAHLVSWHEAHHQGQTHITFNLWKGAQG